MRGKSEDPVVPAAEADVEEEEEEGSEATCINTSPQVSLPPPPPLPLPRLPPLSVPLLCRRAWCVYEQRIKPLLDG